MIIFRFQGQFGGGFNAGPRFGINQQQRMPFQGPAAINVFPRGVESLQQPFQFQQNFIQPGFSQLNQFGGLVNAGPQQPLQVSFS